MILQDYLLPDDIQRHEVEFTGSGKEYFRVWIVNVVLSVLTLGLFTPFARRRTIQYFYGHTLVAGHPLEFTAHQRKMVFGFLVIFGFYAAWQIAERTGQDTVSSLFALSLALLAPYLWASAQRFRLGSTRWRGVRLAFTASWSEVYKASWPVFAIALLWIALSFLIGQYFGEAPAGGIRPPKLEAGGELPVGLLGLVGFALTVLCLIRLEFNYRSLLVRRTRVGDQAGRFKPEFGDFVRVGLATAGVFLLGVAAVVALAGALGMLIPGAYQRSGSPNPVAVILWMVLVSVLVVVGLFVASLPARAYREAKLFQLVWNNVGLAQSVRTKTRLRTGPFVGLRLKNMLLTLLTLGLYRPFAMASEYRAKADSLAIYIKGSRDRFVGRQASAEGSVADALADALGLGVI